MILSFKNNETFADFVSMIGITNNVINKNGKKPDIIIDVDLNKEQKKNKLPAYSMMSETGTTIHFCLPNIEKLINSIDTINKDQQYTVMLDIVCHELYHQNQDIDTSMYRADSIYRDIVERSCIVSTIYKINCIRKYIEPVLGFKVDLDFLRQVYRNAGY